VTRESPRLAQAHLLLGTEYAKVGDPQRGARAYQTFASSCPDHPSTVTVRKILEEYNKAHKGP